MARGAYGPHNTAVARSPSLLLTPPLAEAAEVLSLAPCAQPPRSRALATKGLSVAYTPTPAASQQLETAARRSLQHTAVLTRARRWGGSRHGGPCRGAMVWLCSPPCFLQGSYQGAWREEPKTNGLLA